MDDEYEKGFFKYFYYAIHYALFYWYVNGFVSLCSIPNALKLKIRKNTY
jgi:hypothetical protein